MMMVAKGSHYALNRLGYKDWNIEEYFELFSGQERIRIAQADKHGTLGRVGIDANAWVNEGALKTALSLGNVVTSKRYELG